MKTTSHKRPNQPSEKAHDPNVPAPKRTLIIDIVPQPKPIIGTGLTINWPSQGHPGRQSSPSKPLEATSYPEELKVQIDVTGPVNNLILSNLKLWNQDENLYYEYVVGSLFKHQMIDRNKVINFEKNRHSDPSKDASVMGLVYPVCLDVTDGPKLHLLQADFEILKNDDALFHIESIIAIYRGIITSHNEFMSKPDALLTELPETAPVLWEDAPKREKPVEFINRVYGKYIKQGLMTQGDLRHLDYKLYRAFHNWCGRSEIDPKTIVPAGRRRTEKILDEFGDLTYENSLGLVFKMAHAQDTVPSELVRRGEAFFSLLRRRKINMKQSPS